MSDVIKFGDHARLPQRESETDRLLHEAFLLEEGLDLLASYRSIEDPGVRLSLKTLVESIAARGTSRRGS